MPRTSRRCRSGCLEMWLRRGQLLLPPFGLGFGALVQVCVAYAACYTAWMKYLEHITEDRVPLYPFVTHLNSLLRCGMFAGALGLVLPAIGLAML